MRSSPVGSIPAAASPPGLGRSLGLRTVAEGVEEQAQADMLLCLGCELGQGWLYGRPGPARVLDKRSQIRNRPGHTRLEQRRTPSFACRPFPPRAALSFRPSMTAHRSACAFLTATCAMSTSTAASRR